MRGSLVLMKRIKGHLFRGKNRLVKVVTPLAKNNLCHQYMVEEQNMFYLRYPYLKDEEVRGHAKALEKHEKWLNKWQVERAETYSNKKQKTIESHLEHLKIREDWDVIK